MQVENDRARYTMTGQPTGRPDPWAHAGTNTVPAGDSCPRGHACPPQLGLRARRGHQNVQDIDGAHGICPELHYHFPKFAALAGGDWVNHVPRALAVLGGGAAQPHPLPPGGRRPAAVPPPGNVVTRCTAKLRHPHTCRLTLPHTTPRHGHHGPHHPIPDNNDPCLAAVQECLNQCVDEHLHYCRHEQGPTDHHGWCNALVYLFHTTGTRDPRLRLIQPTRAKQDAHTGPQVTPDVLHLQVGGYCCQGSLSPHTQGAASYPLAALLYILRDVLPDGGHQTPNADVVWPEPLRPRPDAPTPVRLVTTDDQCARATEQAQLRTKSVIVQVGEGQPRPRELHRGITLLVATAVPHNPHMAVNTLEDQPEDAGHLLVHQH